jgi:arsenate reductase
MRAGEVCPAYLGQVIRTHWGVEDPAHVTGTDAEIDAAFMNAYLTLRARIEAFLALPLSDLQGNPERLNLSRLVSFAANSCLTLRATASVSTP